MADGNKRNVVIIMTDQQAYEMVGCNGSSYVHTPNLDGLAASGCRFTGCYTTAPVCTPARAGLFTGMYPASSGAGMNQHPLFDTTRNIGQVFSAGGYASAYIGKWHLDGCAGGYYGTGACPPGFMDEYWYDGRRFIADVGGDGFAKWSGGAGLAPEDCWARRVSDRAVDFLHKHGDGPFLLVCSYDEPHGPSSAPEEYYDMYKGTRRPFKPNMGDSLEDKPALHRALAQLQKHGGRVPDGEMPNNSPRMFGCNTYVDAEIGRVLDAIDRTAPDNTIVLYTVDHGDHQGSHGLIAKGPTMYQETTRVSFFARVPGLTRPGSVSDSVISHIDVAPTLCALAGVEQPMVRLEGPYAGGPGDRNIPQFQGMDVSPVFRDPAAAPRDAAFIEFNRFGLPHNTRWGFTPIRCIVTGRYKLAVNLLDDVDELYDLREDPQELRNLITDPGLAKTRDELHDRLLDWMDERMDPLRGNAWWRRPWRPGKAMPVDYRA
ncbi:MAG: sulfatase-like hydrolase/transferase [Planctomycetes bacterium]|nr:sulfatase-like hydrolase/transferase [Planctomycetota bacterium]